MTKLTIIDNETDDYEFHDNCDCELVEGKVRIVGERSITIRVQKSLGLVAGQRVLLQSKHPELSPHPPHTATFVTETSTEHDNGTVTWTLQIVPRK